MGALRAFLLFSAGMSLVPAAAMWGYTHWALHSTAALAAAPGKGTLSLLAVVGVVGPVVMAAFGTRKVVSNRTRFGLPELAVAYLSLCASFAGAIFLLQLSSPTGAFTGMTVVWTAQAVTADEHGTRLLHALGDALYLSVTTLTTLGYGDLVPRSGWARAVIAIESLTGVGFVALVLGHYFSFCSHRDAGS